ncbi:methylmalonyl-CoA epimerase [Cyclonatronum proteinivorum]|uniref:Methylmalonyl-CoA epimerase n=1 Tax=Cyclonatronum proteinivorum TaxID=1457365 RepID=A0A345UH98_9BACT|nr:methylmalonyl-CoA epimerase [Cyclonatronum proteinivorum]AXI99849.1 methylmalonyl-CoA epimerase [Cyclonatronum proteinivorum]
MNKIEHIGIAVSNLEEAIKTWETLLSTPCYKREAVESEKVDTAFFQTGESKVELLGATSEQSVIHSFIEKRGQGLHHVAFEVDDIRAEMQRLREAGFRLLQEEPKRGADNKLIAFVHPKNSTGVLMELCQSMPESE